MIFNSYLQMCVFFFNSGWEITGAEFSKAELHTAAGISIRFPRCTKIRDDKTCKIWHIFFKIIYGYTVTHSVVVELEIYLHQKIFRQIHSRRVEQSRNTIAL